MKTVVITGGNKGLGLYQSKAFLAAGYAVYVVARSRGDFDQLGQSGDVKAKFIRADLRTENPDALLGSIASQSGGITTLVNNAGAHLKKAVWDVSTAEFDDLVAINLKAMFALCGAYIRLQKETAKDGSIVNISSMAGLLALPNSAAYVTTKTAVIGLTRSVAVDAAPFGINCNAVCPGFIETDMTRAILAKDPSRRERIERRIPTNKFGAPDDVANACIFLASDQANYINGVALPVDAGYSVGF